MIRKGDVVRFKVPYDTGHAFAYEGYEATALEDAGDRGRAVLVEMPYGPGGVPVRQYVTADALAVVAKAG